MKSKVTVGLSSLSSRILDCDFRLPDDLGFELVICIQLDKPIKNKVEFTKLIKDNLCNRNRDIKICFLQS